MVALQTPDDVGTPDWWLLRLGRRLRERNKRLQVWRDYYRGNPPLPQGPARAARAYLDFQRMSRTNFLALVVDASVHRLQVIGFTDEQGQPDDPAWRWWKQNRLDALQKPLYRSALSQSVAYVIVGRHPQDPGRPLATPEHAREVITEDDPATGMPLVALKARYDDVAKVGRATLADSERLYHYVTEERVGGGLPWSEMAWTLERVEPHEFGRPPVVAFECRPELGEEPVAEFDAGMPIQRRINLGVLNRMTAERYSAFRQRWVTGHKFDRQRGADGKALQDPDTGLPLIVNPFIPDPASVWASEREGARFGEFSQTDLMGYLKAHEADILDLLITTHTPAYYYISQLVNISADTVTALDAQHIAKVLEHQAGFGESWEQVVQLMAVVAGETGRDFTAEEVRWRDPRQLNPAVVADRATKLAAIGYPLSVIAEDMGESPQRIRQITSASATQALLAATQAGQPARPAVQGGQAAAPQDGQPE